MPSDKNQQEQRPRQPAAHVKQSGGKGRSLKPPLQQKTVEEHEPLSEAMPETTAFPVQRVLHVGKVRDAEWVDELQETDFTKQLQSQDFGKVQTLLKAWVDIDAEKKFATKELAVAGAAGSLKASARDLDFTDYNTAGFEDAEVQALFSLLGSDVLELVNTDALHADLKSLYDAVDGLNGVNIIYTTIGNDRAFTGLLTTMGGSDTLTGHIETLGAQDTADLLDGKSATKLEKLCDALTAKHVKPLPVSACHLLMERTGGWLDSVETEWDTVGRYLTSTTEVNALIAVFNGGYTMPQIGVLAAHAELDAADLQYLQARSVNYATLRDFLTDAIGGYGQTKAVIKPFMNTNNGAALVDLRTRFLTLVEARSPLSGKEIEFMHTNGSAVITYTETFQTVEERRAGGGTHRFNMTLSGQANTHEIHIHYKPGMNRRTQYATAHIKPDADSTTRKLISDGLAKALLATI